MSRPNVPTFAFLLVLAALGVPALAAPKTIAKKPKQPIPAAEDPAPKKGAAARLRAEWNMGDLKLQHEAVDDATFPADIKSAAIDAVNWFTNQQESLLTTVDTDPKAEAVARKRQPALEVEFNKRMQVVTSNPQFQAEMTRRLKALNKEMDDMADSADKIFASLDAVGVSPAQKAKLQPIVKDASAQLKAVADKSAARTVKDKQVRDEAAATFRKVRAKVKQNLTPEQREKLTKKLAADKDKEDGK